MLAITRGQWLRILRSVVFSVLTGVLAGCLVLAGQCVFRAAETYNQQRETISLVNELERRASRNPLEFYQVKDDGSVVKQLPLQPTDQEKVWVGGFSTIGREIEAYLIADTAEDYRESGRLDALDSAVEGISVHIGTRANLMSGEDRYRAQVIILDAKADISQARGMRGKIIEGRDDRFLVGLAEPLTLAFFDRLRQSSDWFD